jgi:hypothetical protein
MRSVAHVSSIPLAGIGRMVVAGVAVGTFASGTVAAQELPSPAEMDELQAEAESAPLFSDDEPLRLELFVDLEYLKDERPDEEEEPALLRFRQPDRGWADAPAEIRTRGIFRRESRNCSFPPLRLDVPRGQMKGTVFHGQDKLKLVFPCREGRSNYQTLVLREYLAYRMLNLLTPASYRVRLVELTVHDTSGDSDPVDAYGFLIESDEAMAARNRAVISEWEQFHPQGMDVEQATVVSLFQFMIGNTDWSPVFFHNAKLIWDNQGRYLTIAFDFDFSGIVDAPYATPDPVVGIETVRERRYWGFCWEGADFDALNRQFTELRPQFEQLWREMDLMEEGDRRRGLDYLETFYRILETPGSYRRLVVEPCRPMPAFR